MNDFINEFMVGYNVSAADVNFGEVRITGETTVANVLDYFMENYPVKFFFFATENFTAFLLILNL